MPDIEVDPGAEPEDLDIGNEDLDIDDDDLDIDDDEGEGEGPSEDEEAEEAEYQAAMAKLRGERDDKKLKDEEEEDKEGKPTKKPKPKPKSKDEEEEEEDKEGKKPKDDESSGESFKIKVNGEEKSLSKDEMTTYAQKGFAADKRFQEAADETRKATEETRKAQETIDFIRANPLKTLEKLNVSYEDVEDWLYENHIAPKILKGAEKERFEEQRDLKRLRTEKKERERSDKENDEKARQEEVRRVWSERIKSTFDANPDLPRTNEAVNKIGAYMKLAIKKGYRDVTPQDVVPYVKRDLEKNKAQHLGSLSPEQVLAELGPEGEEKIRKALMAKYKPGRQKPTTQRRQRKKADKIPRSPYDLI